MRSIFKSVPVALVAVLALALVASSAALAQSSTLYPAGDSVSLSSTPVTFNPYPGEKVTTTCTLNGGAFTIPAKGNSAGPVTANFTTRPTFTACTLGVKVTTSGTWSMAAQYGDATIAVTAPPKGLLIEWSSFHGETFNAETFSAGSWNNGFNSPLSVSSAMQYGGALSMFWGEPEGKTHQNSFSLALQTMTDTTHPTSIPVLGP